MLTWALAQVLPYFSCHLHTKPFCSLDWLALIVKWAYYTVLRVTAGCCRRPPMVLHGLPRIPCSASTKDKQVVHSALKSPYTVFQPATRLPFVLVLVLCKSKRQAAMDHEAFLLSWVPGSLKVSDMTIVTQVASAGTSLWKYSNQEQEYLHEKFVLLNWFKKKKKEIKQNYKIKITESIPWIYSSVKHFYLINPSLQNCSIKWGAWSWSFKKLLGHLPFCQVFGWSTEITYPEKNEKQCLTSEGGESEQLICQRQSSSSQWVSVSCSRAGCRWCVRYSRQGWILSGREQAFPVTGEVRGPFVSSAAGSLPGCE